MRSPVGKTSPESKKVSYRKIKDIDMPGIVFLTALSKHSRYTWRTCQKLSNTTLAQVLDWHAPLCTKVIRSRPLVPWFNEEIKVARREKRKAERKWRRTAGTREDMLAYKLNKKKTVSMLWWMKLDANSIMTLSRIIVAINAVFFRQWRSTSTGGTTGRCTPLWIITLNWQINWERSLFRKLRP